MAWITEDAEGHEGWAPAVWPDGAVSVGWTAGQVLVRPVGPDGRTALPEQTRDGAGAIGWRGMCECGWQGTLHRAASAPGRRADPPEETEETIRAEWLAHIGQARNLEDIRAEAWAVSAAQARLTEAVRAARTAGHSWNEIGDAAGITRQAAHERWAAVVHQEHAEPAADAPDECTGCGRDDGPMYLDPRPRHPRDPQAQYCQDCAADLFDIGDEEPDHA